jgi:circadian clock protein KaiC
MTAKERTVTIARAPTGVQNLDAILGGGLPRGSITVLAGPPGSGKTILAQQICFQNATSKAPAIYFNTLSEPTAKTLRYLRQFAHFDETKLEAAVRFVDLGVILRAHGLEKASGLVMDHVKSVRPSIAVIDSFKVFDDLSKTSEELRKFGYELAVNLMAWEVTGLLLGEYGPPDYKNNPIFSIVDGLITVHQRESSGEQQRFVQVVKMRGTDHSRDEHAFVINDNGVEVYAPRVLIRRSAGPSPAKASRLETGIAHLDALLGEGIPIGSSLLISGVAGTGKTVLSLEFVYRGAQRGEKGIIFSFEETEERLLANAKGLGWDLEAEIARGMAEIVFIPQPDIMIEKHLLMMLERIEALGAKRVAIDSVSVFLHKVKDSQIGREKIFQIASIVHNARAVAFLAADIPYGSNQVSRLGVEETVVDGVILLTAPEEGLKRERYLEVYKLRNTAHLKGRHHMRIGPGGIQIFPRYGEEADLEGAAPVDINHRLSTGVPGLDALLGGGVLERSVTLVSGSAGIGKTTIGEQFLVEGVRRGETGIYVSLEEGAAQLLESADALGLPLRQAVADGLVEILYLSRERIRAAQYASILADRVGERRAARLILDGARVITSEGASPSEHRELLQALAVRLRNLGTTSMFMLESESLHSTDSVTGVGLSAIADNLVMLRYALSAGELRPVLTVVKARGSAHDRRAHLLEIGEGGTRIADDPQQGARQRRRSRRRGDARTKRKR